MVDITEEIYSASYSLGKDVFDGELQGAEASLELQGQYGIAERTANALIRNLSAMLNGEEYHDTLNIGTTTYYLTRILEDYGKGAQNNALDSLEAHLDYYDTLDRGKHTTLRALVSELRKGGEVLDLTDLYATNSLVASVSATINDISRGYDFGNLQDIRVELKGLRRRPSKTVFPNNPPSNSWTFHVGGRSELQFNLGLEEWPEGTILRHGVAFSLEPSRSMPDVSGLFPKIRRFNEYLAANQEQFAGFKCWYFDNDKRSGNMIPLEFPSELAKEGVFLFIGSAQPIAAIDCQRIVEDFDVLLDVYRYVESTATDNPIVGGRAFEFTSGAKRKLRSTTTSVAEKTINISYRHNILQEKLEAQLVGKLGNNNVHIEVPNGIGGAIDLVTKADGSYTYYEIKIGTNIRNNIRAAVGQLLEYSLWPGTQRPEKLVIVSDAPETKASKAYIKSLSGLVGFPVSYHYLDVDK